MNDQTPETPFVGAVHKCCSLEERCAAVIKKCRDQRAQNQGLNPDLDERIDATETETLSILQEINSIFFKDLAGIAAQYSKAAAEVKKEQAR